MRLIRVACLLTSVATAVTGALVTGTTASAVEARSYAVNTTTLPDGSTTVARWDPCGSRITYRVNVRGLPRADRYGAVRQTKRKVRQLARVSGLRFSYRGKTSFVPRTDNASAQPAQLVVAFVRPSQTDYPLAGRTAGYGGFSFGWQGRTDGSISYGVSSGFVVIDAPDTKSWSTSMRRNGITRPGLLAHELGHAVGLAHVSDRSQVMYPSLHRRSPAKYAAGDRVGLAKVGRPAGCLPPAGS